MKTLGEKQATRLSSGSRARFNFGADALLTQSTQSFPDSAFSPARDHLSAKNTSIYHFSFGSTPTTARKMQLRPESGPLFHFFCIKIKLCLCINVTSSFFSFLRRSESAFDCALAPISAEMPAIVLAHPSEQTIGNRRR